MNQLKYIIHGLLLGHSTYIEQKVLLQSLRILSWQKYSLKVQVSQNISYTTKAHWIYCHSKELATLVSTLNDMIKQNYDVKKVKSSAKNCETVVVSEKALDAEKLGPQIAELGFKLLSVNSEE